MPATEAFSRALIDELLKDQGWKITDGHGVRFEHPLPDNTRADYLLCDRRGRGLAVIEAKNSSINPADAAAQALHYARLAEVPFVFLANGREIRFWDWQREAHPHPVRTFFAQDDLERRAASRQLRVDPLTKPIDRRIAGRDYQVACIDALCREIQRGRRKLLVEMATGTGKTRTAAALIKRLFEANAVTRVLFLVDRIPLALQTEDAFSEHLRDYPCYVLRAGRRFQDEKRITITTLQSMINLYHDYSAGYFDLIVTDECHRSIYGKWRKVLEYFDGIQIGLTATPCVARQDYDDGDEDQLFVRDTLRFFEVDQPTFVYTLKQAVEEGYLVGYQIYQARTVKTAAEGGFEVRRDEIVWDELDAATRQELEAAFGDKNTLTVDPSALERKFTIPERNRAIVREFRQVMEQGYHDAKGIRRKPLIGKTIVFAVTKRHAETLARLLDAEFAHPKPSPEVRYADYVVSGQGQEDTVDGVTRIRRFKKDKFPQVLVSVNMLDTGFDCPEVVNLLFARFTKSVILYRQMRGRGTRKAPGKPSFTMFDRFRWSQWARALSGEKLARFVRDEVFPFYTEVAEHGAVNFMDGARLVIDEPVVLTQIVGKVDQLRLDDADADTKGDLFEHVLKQIRQAGELGQFRTPRHIIRAIVRMIDPRIGETVYDPAAGTAGFLVATFDHLKLANSSIHGIEAVELDGKTVPRGHGDSLSAGKWNLPQTGTFFGNDVDAKMVRLATMNLTLRGLPDVRILHRNALTTTLDAARKTELGLPVEGFHVILANPPFSGRVDKDRIVEDVKVGGTTATEILFLKYMMDNLRPGGRCGVIVPEGVLFGSTGAHKELRRQLIENHRVEAVLSLPGGVFQPYSGVKTSVLLFSKAGSTERVLFLHADHDGYKLDANHDTPVEADDLPDLIAAYQTRVARWAEWQARDPQADWTAKWWFADVATLRANDFNLSAGRYRPLAKSQVEHRDPRELLDELAAIEAEIAEEIEALRISLSNSSECD
jgi:type I restriction enzyme R subunit